MINDNKPNNNFGMGNSQVDYYNPNGGGMGIISSNSNQFMMQNINNGSQINSYQNNNQTGPFKFNKSTIF